jgi:hypothetical protein
LKNIKEFTFKFFLNGIVGIGVISGINYYVKEFGDLSESDLIEGKPHDALLNGR